MSLTEDVSVGFVYSDGGGIDDIDRLKEYVKNSTDYSYRPIEHVPDGSAVEIYSNPAVSVGSDIIPEINETQPIVDVTTDFYEFYNRDDARKQFNSYLDMVKLVYDLTGPDYGFGLNNMWLSEYGSDIVPTVSDDGITDPDIQQPAWIMLFSPQLVEYYGRDWLEGLPVDYAETLDDGGMLLVTEEDVTNINECASSMEGLKDAFVDHD